VGSAGTHSRCPESFKETDGPYMSHQPLCSTKKTYQNPHLTFCAFGMHNATECKGSRSDGPSERRRLPDAVPRLLSGRDRVYHGDPQHRRRRLRELPECSVVSAFKKITTQYLSSQEKESVKGGATQQQRGAVSKTFAFAFAFNPSVVFRLANICTL